MRQEVENPMLLPEPTYTREQRREVEIELPEVRTRLDAFNRQMAEKSRMEATQSATQKITA